MRKLILIIFLTATISIQAQEFNYWLSGVGSRSNMLAGAVTAGVRDNSAIFYNPAGLAFIENSSLSVSSNGYFLGKLNAKNAVGTNLDLKSTTIDGVPQIVSFIQKVPKLPISVTLALVNTHYSNLEASYRNKMFYDILPDNPGDELYLGSYSYSNKIREDWVGFGYGKQLSDKLGLGVSTFVSYRNQKYFLNQTADVYDSYADSASNRVLSNSIFTDELKSSNFGLLFVIGATYNVENIKLGLTITTPRINIGFVSSSNLKRNAFINIPSVYTDIYNVSIWQVGVASRYRSPFMLDLGADFNITPRKILHTKVSFFGPVKKYNMLKEEINEENNQLVIPSYQYDDIGNMTLVNKPIINAAVALQHHVSENLEAIIGFRTDFNYLDKDELDSKTEFVPGNFTLNLYHVSGGVVWKTDKYDLSLGSSYTFGYQKNELQYVNLSEPLPEANLFGVRQFNNNPRYTQLGLFLGFTYFFSRI